MKKTITILFYLLVSIALKAQCFSIESILADACGDPEGENEMVVLRTNTIIDIDNLVFDWPNNSFLGWCANPNKTALLNQGIVSSCGLLLEPQNGIVPSGKKILVVSSTNMQVNANSFDGLTDTLYIVYQCAGNTVGHFSNTSTGSRTLTVDYNGACNGSESVSYVGADLIGGDGGAVFYDLAGNRSYYNTGCNAPVPSINPNWSFPPKICSNYGLMDLNKFLPPTALGIGVWSGPIQNAHFFDPSTNIGANSITYTVIDPKGCLLSADSTINFVVENIKSGNDTVVVCDSINQFGVWIYQDTIVEIAINYSNPYICDSMIYRYYFINKTDFSLAETDVKLNADESYDFVILGSSAYTYNYTNTLGEECVSPCNNTTVSPEESTVYSISITSENNFCTSLLSLNVARIYHSELQYPNTFTPNADGENDVFKLYGKDLKTINFKIFSAWGELLYEGKSLSDTWDGNFQNKPLSSGVYLLQIDVLGKDNIPYKETIRLNLVR